LLYLFIFVMMVIFLAKSNRPFLKSRI